MATPEYAVGDVIEKIEWGGDRTLVFVELREDDIKNERPGFDGFHVRRAGDVFVKTDVVGGTWGYDSQVARVVARGAKVAR